MSLALNFQKLVKLPPNPLPQTDSIDFLFRSLAREACNSVRGGYKYYQIVSRSREICDRINGLIFDAGRTKDWSKYKTYTVQIRCLEQLLYRISKIAPTETTPGLPIGPKSVPECLDQITFWRINTDLCRDVLMELHSQPFEIPKYNWELEVRKAALQDDTYWFWDVCAAMDVIIKSLLPDTRLEGSQISHITPVVERIYKIRTTLHKGPNIEERRMSFCIRCFMVLHGIMVIVVDPDTTNSVRTHLSSPITWTQALSLLEGLHGILRDPSRSPDKLIEDWDNYEEYLLKPEPDVDELLNDLISYPPAIRLPYQTQSQTLIQFCLDIGEHVKTENPVGGIESFEEIIKMVTNAMSLCAGAVTHITKLDWEALRNNAAGQAIDEAVAKIRSVCANHQMTPEDIDGQMSTALNNDRESVKSLMEYVGYIEERYMANREVCQCNEASTVCSICEKSWKDWFTIEDSVETNDNKAKADEEDKSKSNPNDNDDDNKKRDSKINESDKQDSGGDGVKVVDGTNDPDGAKSPKPPPPPPSKPHGTSRRNVSTAVKER